MQRNARNRQSSATFTPAFPVLGLYDLVVRLASRDRTWRSALGRHLATSAADRIVDAGCGTATFLTDIGRKVPEAELIGIDPDERVLARAREKLDRAGVMAVLHPGYLRDLGKLLDRRPATKLTSSLVFHQVPLAEKRAGLAAMFDALAPGGLLLIADYGRQRTATMRLLFRLVQFVDGFADTQPNADGIIPELMRAAGFTDVSEVEAFPTATGSISIYRAKRPASPAPRLPN